MKMTQLVPFVASLGLAAPALAHDTDGPRAGAYGARAPDARLDLNRDGRVEQHEVARVEHTRQAWRQAEQAVRHARRAQARLERSRYQARLRDRERFEHARWARLHAARRTHARMERSRYLRERFEHARLERARAQARTRTHWARAEYRR